MTNLLKSAFLCCPVFVLAACGGFTELDSVANVAACNLPTIGAARITPDRTMYAKAGGNLSCGGRLENDICYGGYAIRPGKSGDGCIDLNTNEFKIGEGAKISCNGITIVTGPKEGKLSDYNAKCR